MSDGRNKAMTCPYGTGDDSCGSWCVMFSARMSKVRDSKTDVVSTNKRGDMSLANVQRNCVDRDGSFDTIPVTEGAEKFIEENGGDI
jgi:hypothetical protein